MPPVKKTERKSAPQALPSDIPRARRAASPAPAPAGPSDRDTELSRALEAVQAVDDVRAARVAALRKQIQDGTYQPDPREVARQILEHGL
jgi:flagellar biosynthesis anti-sigma factor FlgM